MNQIQARSARYIVKTAKVCEAILWLANTRPGIDLYHVVKCIFYADKQHLNLWGRPVTGDTYDAAQYGPLGQTVYGLLKGSPMEILAMGGNGNLPFVVGSEFPFEVTAHRSASMDMLSTSDIEALRWALREYGDKSFDELVELSHAEPAYILADGGVMKYEDLLDDTPDREERADDLRETARFSIF